MTRVAEHEIKSHFLERWSPRAMSGEPVSEGDLLRLFEAARWAPSSGNNQPWRFVYGRAGTASFDGFFNLLVEANRAWCVNAGALVVVLSRKVNDAGKPARTHSFDTGAAWMSLALQGTAMGLVVHGMQGFDYERARAELGVPEEFAVEAMIAIGHPGKVEDLSEKDQAREKPNTRKPLKELVFEGRFPAA
ncbi:MAG TPA: nitroreductase family protein [Bryobacteraceae bacterium]|jgi:nitroreductase